MGLFTYLLRKSMKPLRTPSKPPGSKPKGKPGANKKPLVPFKGTSIYKGPRVVRGMVKKKTPLSSAGGDFIASLIGSSTPGAKKMQFPFENIPPVSVNVGLEPSTQRVILGLGGMIFGGIVVGSLLKRGLKTS